MSIMVKSTGGGSYPYEIYVATPPNKTEYTEGDTLSLSGMTVKAKFNNGKEKDITDEVTTVPADGSVLNDYEVTSVDITWENKGLEYKTATPISISPPWELISWSTGTPEQIQKMLQAHYDGEINIHDYWPIGATRTVHLSAMAATGVGESHAEQDVELVLMHAGGYELAEDPVETPVGNLSVGDTIQLNENGSPVDYIIVHQGLPSEMYDESCNGTWVVRKDIAENRVWDSTNNDYQNSDIHAYLNLQYLSIFDGATKSAIKQAKIPFVNGAGNSPVASGSDGLNCKIFLLSSAEVGSTTNTLPNDDGAKLDYFTDNNSRIAMLNGTASNWWLRSPYTSNSTNAGVTSSAGGFSTARPTTQNGVRPAFILDPTFTVKVVPRCAFIVGQKDCLNERGYMNPDKSNVGGWRDTARRTWCNDTYRLAYPDDIRGIFKRFKCISGRGQEYVAVESEDYFTLPAEKEISGKNTYAAVVVEAELLQFDWHKIDANRKKNVNGVADWYYNRSSTISWNFTFCNTEAGGNQGYADATLAGGLAPQGCI